MQVQIESLKGKVIKNKETLRDFFTSLDDGSYIVSIDRVNPLLTPRDLQKAYFDKIDTCVMHTGNTRYVIHEEFKKHAGIESTKDLEVKEWKEILSKLGWWAYEKFDCII